MYERAFRSPHLSVIYYFPTTFRTEFLLAFFAAVFRLCRRSLFSLLLIPQLSVLNTFQIVIFLVEFG